MITKAGVIKRLGVSELQLENAIYSGRLPRPFMGMWGSSVEPFLRSWEKSLAAKRPKLTGEAHADFMKPK